MEMEDVQQWLRALQTWDDISSEEKQVKLCMTGRQWSLILQSTQFNTTLQSLKCVCVDHCVCEPLFLHSVYSIIISGDTVVL